MINKELKESVELLQDPNLIWGSDLEDIKGDLANLLLASASQGGIIQTLAENLAKKIVYSNREANYDPKWEKR